MTYILNLPVNSILSENLELVRKIVYKFYIKNIYISIRAKKTNCLLLCIEVLILIRHSFV